MITIRRCTWDGNPMVAIVDGKLFISGWLKRFVANQKYGIRQ